MRELLAAKAAALLQSKGYSISSFFEYNSCFDVAAKKTDSILLLKVFENADALREEQAKELEKLALAFNAKAMIIAEKTKVFKLKDNVVYERYGLPVLSIASFASYLKNIPLNVRCFKGKETVCLDSEKMREKRKKLGLTLSELAEQIGLSTQAMHRSEKNSQAALATAKKIETVLQEKIIKGIDLFEKKTVPTRLFESKLEDESLEKIQKLGLELALFEHAPFKAFTNPEETLLIDKGYSKQDLKKKSLLLEKTRTILQGHSVIISKEAKYKRIGNTPIVQEEELESFSKPKDLFETIKQRENKKKEKTSR